MKKTPKCALLRPASVYLVSHSLQLEQHPNATIVSFQTFFQIKITSLAPRVFYALLTHPGISIWVACGYGESASQNAGWAFFSPHSFFKFIIMGAKS